MTNRRNVLLGAFVLGAALVAAPAIAQQKEVTIAYQDMIVPWRVAHAAGEIEKATGYKVNFRQFGGGGDVIRALASGQVQIGEAGSAPIAAGISQGLPVELFWILDDINDAEALIVRNGSGINTLADLKGKKIGVPFWAKQNAEFVTKFVQILAAADERYRRDKAKWTAASPEAAAIAKITGAKVEDVPAGLALYRFPTAKEQASPTWLGGGKASGAAASLAATAAFLKSQGTIANVLPDYSVGVNPAYAAQVAK